MVLSSPNLATIDILSLWLGSFRLNRLSTLALKLARSWNKASKKLTAKSNNALKILVRSD